MKLYVHKNFDGVFLGGLAVVLASSRQEAAQLLQAELDRQELSQREPIHPDKFEQLAQTKPAAVILDNGDY